MLPGPTEDSHHASSSEPTTSLHHSHQHGSDLRSDDASAGSQPRPGPGPEGSVAAGVGAGETAPGRHPAPSEGGLSHLIKAASRGKEIKEAVSPPGSHSKSKTKNRGQNYLAIARSKGATVGGRQLLDLPNEILTHVLSYLPAESLTTAALVSHRFHLLVTTPHAWRAAFLRYFPGTDAGTRASTHHEAARDVPGGRSFTRLTAFSSWRSEYILRTRILRSLARGKPPNPSATSTHPGTRARQANSFVLYDSQMPDVVDRLNGDFGSGSDNRRPNFRYGTTEGGRTGSSDPANSAPDSWGRHDMQGIQTFDGSLFGGRQHYGLGAGEVVGNPNPMDVSQPYGMITGEGMPGGKVYFHHVGEQRGRILSITARHPQVPEVGVPYIDPSRETICSVWIAKSVNIPTISNGCLGLLSGASTGVLTAYSLGTEAMTETRLQRGEITAKWAICPGVPITSIQVDDAYNMKRYGQQRIIAFVMNALGEVYYLKQFFSRVENKSFDRSSEDYANRVAWTTGRSVPWTLIESTRRTANTPEGHHGPRSSWIGTGLTLAEIASETHEVEDFIRKQPKYFQEHCQGWDMQRRLEVDFAGDDEQGSGESLLVFNCGIKDGANLPPKTTRLVHRKNGDPLSSSNPDGIIPEELSGESSNQMTGKSSVVADTWMRSDFSFGDLEAPEIVTTSIDCSNLATITMEEDPLLNLSTSAGSSPWSSPGGTMPRPASASEIPGHRARLVAAGTNDGRILLWDMRAPTSHSPELVNTIAPLRVIQTDSPRITCLALSALYLVHGGSDGLVQAWDPLASDSEPIRTLNSRYSIRARRRFVIANTTPENTRPNFFVAGAIVLDPDATRLRGMVSLGSLLRYWSYSTDAADHYRRSKRRWRHAHRGSNHGDPTVVTTSRVSGAMKGFIADEQAELERERRNNRDEQARLAKRFGVGLLGPGATEDEMLAYATLLSNEAEEQRLSGSNSISSSVQSTGFPLTPPRHMSHAPSTPAAATSDADAELEEAIRRSLQDSESSNSPEAFPIRYVRDRRRSPRTSPLSTPIAGPSAASPLAMSPATSSSREEADDMEFALQLSLAEEQSRVEAEAVEDFGVRQAVAGLTFGESDEGSGKGKGKERAR